MENNFIPVPVHSPSQAAVTIALAELDTILIQFSSQDWILIAKVVKILKSFEEATKLLSAKDATISHLIPIVFLLFAP